MAEFTAADLAIVIPTRDRWDILDRTLQGLSDQSVSGFETIVVVDGTDQNPPPLDATTVLAKRRAGPGAARNHGARSTERSLVMFLGDDTIPSPDLVEQHLAAHCRHPEREAGAVGYVDWHGDVAHNRINRWLEWSGTQSWYASLADTGEQEVSHWYFYTSNISVKRELLLEGDGFDEDFPFAAFEDLECGVRLASLGLRLYYEPAAVCHHLHDYDWPSLERRFACMALSERLMVDMHPDIEAGCLARMKSAVRDSALPLDGFVDLVPRRWKRLDRLVRQHANRRYHRRLAPSYLLAWDRGGELCELRRYLGDRYDSARLVYRSERPRLNDHDQAQPDGESHDEERLFGFTNRALEGRTDEALSLIQQRLRPRSAVLDYGCGTGSNGLQLAQSGHSVSFADDPGVPLAYLRWRLDARGLDLPVMELGADQLPGHFDAAVCLDAGSPGRDPVELLDELEQIAPIVALGFFRDRPESLKASVPIEVLESRPRLSTLTARHELGGGGTLLVYERRGMKPTAPDRPAMDQGNDMPSRSRL